MKTIETGESFAGTSWRERLRAAIPQGIAVATDVFAERALNAQLWDVDGRRYIDFAGGIGVLNVGHRHPRVLQAVHEQAERFLHTCWQVIPYPGYVQLAEVLNRLAPLGGAAAKTALFSTGAEAVENAVKIARAATGRTAVIAFSGAFHGRTAMGMALTGKVTPYKSSFGALPPEVFHAPFPADGVDAVAALQGLNRIFRADVDPRRVAAIIIEPVQGEGGFHAAPFEFLRELRTTCDQHGIVLIADEIQSGFGRTGTWFAIDQSGITPDLITCAKSLAGGLPLSAVIGRAELMDAVPPGGLGGTYAGNPVAVAAALAVVEVMLGERLTHRSDVLGRRLRERLDALRPEIPALAELRGLGSMAAAAFRHPDGRPHPQFAKRVVDQALQRGLILLTCGAEAEAIRFLYPLTIEDDTFAEALDLLAASLHACVA
ncbi:4-aminobutyrate--2-oxoglutarate transaminase [Ramlibacter tataouinensis]|uniref:4-aminobutyrate--2-oxoglutarate transaminase n=1 Tax=Ramlibacter tataouinensis TaxID=94132 RepID=UPI0022F3CDCC|nr:4-aminobutyrate--2-oxoglutarate transaminase [Ramlibacter tataouinensis]WBY01228.1 4-aminobutyrate--2-oxoglutarate transaminase [Ramlibacter tataouinensis]